MTDFQPKPSFRRTTALCDAFVKAFADQGVNLPENLLPTKKEQDWKVSKRDKKAVKRRG
jgi:hypothetical protein